MQALGTAFTIACPAFPANGRTIYKGHLFVGDALLSDSGMRHHPLTPMTDANLVRVLQQQVKGKVGLVEAATVAQGPQAIRARFAALRREGCNFAVVDALSDDDLMAIGAACADMPLVTAGSGIALGLPQNFRHAGLLADTAVAAALPAAGGLRAVVSGSCSIATQGQVAAMRKRHPAFHVDPLRSRPRPRCRGRSAGVGEEPRRRRTRAGLRHGHARVGQGGAGPARCREGRQPGRRGAGGSRPRAGGDGRRPADRRRRRDLRRGGQGARAWRGCASAPKSIPACPGRRRWAAGSRWRWPSSPATSARPISSSRHGSKLA